MIYEVEGLEGYTIQYVKNLLKFHYVWTYKRLNDHRELIKLSDITGDLNDDDKNLYTISFKSIIYLASMSLYRIPLC